MDTKINWNLILRTAPTGLIRQELSRRVQEEGRAAIAKSPVAPVRRPRSSGRPRGRRPTCGCGKCKKCIHRKVVQAYRQRLKEQAQEREE